MKVEINMKTPLSAVLCPLSCVSLLSLLSFVSLSSFALGEDVTCRRFPDADAVQLDEIERVRYNPDGTYEQTDECWTKILTEKGRREESSLTLDYSRRYGEAAIVYVGAIGTNGQERAIDVSATTSDKTDNSAMSANIYDPLDRKIVCTVPGLKIGETLHVKTRRKTTKPRCQDKWADISVMEWRTPILKSTYEVTAPAARPLRKIAIRHPLGNVVTNVAKLADGSLVHTFTATNSAQVFPEPDMPPLYTQVQNVRVSTAENWPEISRWYWDLCVPHLAKTNAAMVAKVEELTKDARRKTADAGQGEDARRGMEAEARTARDEAMKRIFKFVSQEVRYMGLTMEDTSPGYAPHDVDVTFDNRYGVCRDKAGLLVAMLRLAGFKAFPVLIHVGAKLDPEVPQPFFNHAIVAVEEDGRSCASLTSGKDSASPLGDKKNGEAESFPLQKRSYILMDPTNENTKDLFPAYLCNCSYLVARPEGEELKTSPVPSPESNALAVTSSGTVMKDGSLFLENALRFDGINDTAYRHALVRMKPENRVKFFEKVVKKVAPGAELIRCDIEPKDMRDTSRPVEVKLASKLPESVLRGASRDALNVPFVSTAMGIVNFLLTGNTALVTRKYPLVLDTTACVRETLTLDLAGTLDAVAELPADERNRSAGYEYVRSFACTNETLTASRSVTVSEVEFSPEAYGDLREEIKNMEAAERKRPVFAQDALREADVRRILEVSETSIESDAAWVTTNTVVKQVLTYEGKRRSSELKFRFNPSVERLGILSAVVSNRNGQVVAISEREINVMDCEWAASAPRYPASKLLVVNLPSVEIGSVISYQYVRAVTNAPATFYAAYEFDAHEPLERKVVRVDGWRREVKSPRRIPNEPNQPAAALWRDQVVVTRNRFAPVDLKLRPCRVGELTSLKELRDWMAKYVKVAGPGLYELPLDRQLTDPDVVLAERYATRLDYVRTLCSLLRESGYEADVVFAANDADEPEELRRRIKFEQPNVRAFATALCRVRVGKGGFLGFGGEEKTYFVGTENQYAPLGPTAYEGCDYYDPEDGTFGVVTVPDEAFRDFDDEKSEYLVREDGAVDLTVENTLRGTSVGGFRKTYSEILPEDRSRRYQAILGAVAQAATATRELETDVESYPAKQRFSCYVPDLAVVQGDMITLQIPPLVSSVPSCVGTARQTPFAVEAADGESEQVTIRFPEGYTKVESLPTPFVLANPLNPSEIWLESKVTTEVKDGVLSVRLSRKVGKRAYSWFGPEFYELVKDWNRIAGSRASRTVTVRK